MTFLYLTSVAITVLVIFYVVGYVIAFCMLFFHFDEHKVKCLKADLVYALLSWVLVAIAILCWALEMEEENSKYD